MKITELIKSKKTLLSDFSLNFIASILTTGIVQLILYPWLSRIVSAEEYGLILTIMGVANTIAATVGGSLNNTRLVVEADYRENDVRGDFLPILLGGNIIGIIVMALYLLFQGQNQLAIMLGITIYVFTASYRNYANVYFRIELNYKKILILSIIVAMGNLLGVLFIWMFDSASCWFLVFVIGEILGSFYLLFFSSVRKEAFLITKKFGKIMHIEIALLVTTLIANLLIYLDRLLLLPVLGGEAVSVYTVASFLGKSFGVIMTPLSGVLLSYYAKKDYNMSRKKFWEINLAMAVVSLPFFLVTALCARLVTGFFYPTIIDQATPYLIIANAAAIINTTGTMTQPAVLKFANADWQIVIQLAYAAVYLGLGLLGAKVTGMQGFTIAALIASLARLLLFYLIGDISIKNRSE